MSKKKKKGFLKLYNILSSIYLYVTIQNFHIRGKRDNKGKNIYTNLEGNM
jgi:hypothetical protein